MTTNMTKEHAIAWFMSWLPDEMAATTYEKQSDATHAARACVALFGDSWIVKRLPSGKWQVVTKEKSDHAPLVAKRKDKP